MTEISNEIALTAADSKNAVSGIAAALEGMKTGNAGNIMSTFQGTDFATKVKTLKAVTNSKPLSENLGKTIMLENVVVQIIEMPDEKTGVLTEVPRIILVDADGTTYHAISNGIFKSLENTFALLGQPAAWEEALPVQVSEERSRTGFRFMTLNVVDVPAPAKGK